MILRCEETTLQAKIHPVWLIDEYARSGRNCVWLIPPIPPTIAPIVPTSIKTNVFGGKGMWIRSQIGIIFCQVVKRRHNIHLRLDITFGSQKWQGAAPALVKSLNKKSIKGVSGGINRSSFVENVKIIPARKVADPIAWAKKYFIAASVSWFLEDMVIRGIIERRFNSILAHIIIQLFLEIAIKVESPNVEINREEKGWKEIIKIEEELNLLCQN